MKRIGLLIFLLALPLAGCSRQERADAGDKAERAAEQAEHALKDAGKSLSDGSITMKVKSAMSVSDKLNSSDIDVDTKNKVVHLRGTVADENQRALAERIAVDTVGADVKVMNELKVGSNKSQENKAKAKAKAI